jgi:hypothetical protein
MRIRLDVFGSRRNRCSMSLALLRKLSSNAVALEIFMGRKMASWILFPSSYGARPGHQVCKRHSSASLSRIILILLARARPADSFQKRPYYQFLCPTLPRFGSTAARAHNKANVGCWHIAGDVLASLKVRYGIGGPAATYFGERPESARPGRSPRACRRSAHHPSRPFGALFAKGSSGHKAILTRSKALTRHQASRPRGGRLASVLRCSASCLSNIARAAAERFSLSSSRCSVHQP